MRKNIIVERLQNGESVEFKPHGNSMTPRLESGQLVKVDPVKIEDVQVGDVVYCKVKGRTMLHLVTAVGQDGRVQISNNHGWVNGWTRIIYGRLNEDE